MESFAESSMTSGRKSNYRLYAIVLNVRDHAERLRRTARLVARDNSPEEVFRDHARGRGQAPDCLTAPLVVLVDLPAEDVCNQVPTRDALASVTHAVVATSASESRRRPSMHTCKGPARATSPHQGQTCAPLKHKLIVCRGAKASQQGRQVHVRRASCLPLVCSRP